MRRLFRRGKTMWQWRIVFCYRSLSLLFANARPILWWSAVRQGRIKRLCQSVVCQSWLMGCCFLLFLPCLCPQSFLTFSSPLSPLSALFPLPFPSRPPLPFQLSQCPPWLNGRLPLEAGFRCRVPPRAYGYVKLLYSHPSFGMRRLAVVNMTA